MKKRMLFCALGFSDKKLSFFFLNLIEFFAILLNQVIEATLLKTFVLKPL